MYLGTWENTHRVVLGGEQQAPALRDRLAPSVLKRCRSFLSSAGAGQKCAPHVKPGLPPRGQTQRCSERASERSAGAGLLACRFHPPRLTLDAPLALWPGGRAARNRGPGGGAVIFFFFFLLLTRPWETNRMGIFLFFSFPDSLFPCWLYVLYSRSR